MRLQPLVAIAVFVSGAMPAAAGTCSGNSTGKVPLPELGAGFYRGYQGGFYPGGSNVPPPTHLTEALSRAASIRPLDAQGNPDDSGFIGVLSIGGSVLVHKMGTFERDEDAGTSRNPRIVLVNGGYGGGHAYKIADPGHVLWSLIPQKLQAAGLTPSQVQVLWMELSNANDPDNFPVHAERLLSNMIQIVKNAQATLPNVQLGYLSPRTYGGYNTVSPEPQAYETAFAVKWLIEDQIDGNPELNFDPNLGPVEAPLLLWGPYLWADGIVPSAQGLSWCACDFENCSDVHVDDPGEQKVSDLFDTFLATDPTALVWWPNPGLPRQVAIDAEADASIDAGAPMQNFGSEELLFSRSGTVPAWTFLRFDFSNVPRPVDHAKLSYRNEDEPVGNVRTVSGTWDESTITWNNAPAVDGAVTYVVPTSSRDGSPSLDVAAEVNADADGVITFALQGQASGTDYRIHSREGIHPPRLVLTPPVGNASGAGQITDLRLGRTPGGDLSLAWSSSCAPADADYEVYEGSLGDFTSHAAATCSTTGATSWTLSPGPGSAYYLVVPRNASVEGSYGRSSAGTLRPAAATACETQLVGPCG